ncbi:MAG: MFS transporter [Sutterella wadsworthensis]
MMRKPAIGFVLACVFLDALGIGLIVPVLPRLIGSLADTRDLQTSWYGAIMVSYGLMQFFFAPILGALSDRIGRRPVLLTGILGLSIMMIVPAVSQTHWASGSLFLFFRGSSDRSLTRATCRPAGTAQSW